MDVVWKREGGGCRHGIFRILRSGLTGKKYYLRPKKDFQSIFFPFAISFCLLVTECLEEVGGNTNEAIFTAAPPLVKEE